MNENEFAFLRKIVKSLVYTFIMIIASLLVFYLLISLIPGGQSDIIYMFIAIIFTIFFCTFTILDELKKRS